MKRGFSYLFFLFFVFILLTLIIGFSAVLQHYMNIQKLDESAVQAKLYAQSAADFYKSAPILGEVVLNKPDLKILKNAEGLTYPLQYGGFKIIKTKTEVYFIGYAGHNLGEAKALKVLILKDGKLKPWREH